MNDKRVRTSLFREPVCRIGSFLADLADAIDQFKTWQHSSNDLGRPLMAAVHKKANQIISTAFALSVSVAALAQTDPPGFVQIVPDQIKWAQSPSIPTGGQGAVVYGDPRRAAPYITRVKLPADYKIQPHTHPEERVYTVISGTFYIGFGEKFDPTRLKAFPAGSVFVVPAKASHFHWMRSGEAVVQVSGVGPSGIEYIDHSHDPRK
jgi:quercetin dioxygenase-like cupin family protein